MGRTIAVAICLSSCFSLSGAAELPGKWQVRAPTPAPRSEVAAAELNGKIYLMGGYVKNGDLLEEYDPEKR